MVLTYVSQSGAVFASWGLNVDPLARDLQDATGNALQMEGFAVVSVWGPQWGDGGVVWGTFWDYRIYC